MSVLKKALEIVNSRNKRYGDPVESWEKIAQIVSIRLRKKVTAIECMIVIETMKQVRESYEHKTDNLIDEAGYVEIRGRLWKQQEKDT